MGETCFPTDTHLPALLGTQENALDAYRAAVSRVSPLSDGQEQDLHTIILNGRQAEAALEQADTPETDKTALCAEAQNGRQAMELLVVSHLGDVLAMARRLSYTKDLRAELAAAGNLALVRSTQYFQPGPDSSFGAFIAVVARNAMVGYINGEQYRHTGLTRGMRNMLRQIDTAYRETQETEPGLDYMEVAERLGFERKAVSFALQLKHMETVSIDEPIMNGSLTTLGDTLSVPNLPDGTDEILDKILLLKVWDVAREMHEKELLSEREWLIFVNRFGYGKTQQEIGDAIGIAQTGVGDWERKILQKIRYAVENPTTLALPEVTETQAVRTSIHLLGLLGISVPKGTEPRRAAYDIIENTPLATAKQRQVLHKILGTKDGVSKTPAQIARELGTTPRAVLSAAKRAVNNIANWHNRDEHKEFTDRLINLGIPVPDGQDVRAATRAMIDNAPTLTTLQREVLHAHLGTIDGVPMSINALAAKLGTGEPSTRRRRDAAIRNLIRFLQASKASAT